MSEIRTDNINNASGDNDSGIDLSTNDQVKIKTANTTAVTVDASQNVGIGTSSPTSSSGGKLLAIETTADVHTNLVFNTANTDKNGIIEARRTGRSGAERFAQLNLQNNSDGGEMRFYTASSGSDISERMRITESGNLLVGKTDQTANVAGVEIESSGTMVMTRSGNTAMFINRTSDNGDFIEFRKDNGTRGVIGTNNDFGLGKGDTGIYFSDGADAIIPCNATGGYTNRDNAIDIGYSSVRFDDVYATNGTIQTSDQQEKNTITDSDLGIDFIKRLTPKSYIFNGKTRTHYGLIAQDVETVLTDINKPTSGFAGFIKSDISEEQDGSEYRYGLRYTEFVAPLIQAVKDQQAIIEDLQARITALENA